MLRIPWGTEQTCWRCRQILGNNVGNDKTLEINLFAQCDISHFKRRWIPQNTMLGGVMLWHSSFQNNNFSETKWHSSVLRHWGQDSNSFLRPKIHLPNILQTRCSLASTSSLPLVFQIVRWWASCGFDCLQYPSQNPLHCINLGARQLNAESRTKTGINAAHLLKPSRWRNDGNEGS